MGCPEGEDVDAGAGAARGADGEDVDAGAGAWAAAGGDGDVVLVGAAEETLGSLPEEQPVRPRACSNPANRNSPCGRAAGARRSRRLLSDEKRK